jgi:hypothetical protein
MRLRPIGGPSPYGLESYRGCARNVDVRMVADVPSMIGINTEGVESTVEDFAVGLANTFPF